MISYILIFLLPYTWNDIQACNLIAKNEYYISREDALLIDDNKLLKEAIKRQCIKQGLMYAYQTTLFDDGFGQACTAMRYAREAYQEKNAPDLGEDIPIRRGKE